MADNEVVDKLTQNIEQLNSYAGKTEDLINDIKHFFNKSGLSNVIDLNKIKTMTLEDVKTVINDFGQNVIDKIKDIDTNNAISQNVIEKYNELKGVVNNVNSVADKINNIDVNNIVNQVKDFTNDFGQNVIDKIKDIDTNNAISQNVIEKYNELKGVVNNVNSVADKINNIDVNNIANQAKDFMETTKNLSDGLNNIAGQATSITNGITNTLNNANQAIDEADKTIKNADNTIKDVDKVAKSADEAVQDVKDTSEKAKTVLIVAIVVLATLGIMAVVLIANSIINSKKKDEHYGKMEKKMDKMLKKISNNSEKSLDANKKVKTK